VRFGILGPLLVHDGDKVIRVPAARQRVLLAALLVRAGKTVPASTLADVVWDGTPPAGAVTTLRSHVMRLRRVLGPSAGDRLVTRYPGYLVEAREQEVDLLRFTALCREGSVAMRAGTWAQASEVLAEALALWRGPPLADIASELLHQDEVPRLEQLRLQAQEWRIDAGLHLGGHRELVLELQTLIAQHPLREHFHAQLMLALYWSGRQAEALAAYQHVRGLLIAELGAEPGAELRELHRRILSTDPYPDPPAAVPRSAAASTAGPVTPVSPVGPAVAIPRQLPAPVANFAGRVDELAALTALLDRGRGASTRDDRDLRHRRDSRGGQDRPGRVLGASDRGTLP